MGSGLAVYDPIVTEAVKLTKDVVVALTLNTYVPGTKLFMVVLGTVVQVVPPFVLYSIAVVILEIVPLLFEIVVQSVFTGVGVTGREGTDNGWGSLSRVVVPLPTLTIFTVVPSQVDGIVYVVPVIVTWVPLNL